MDIDKYDEYVRGPVREVITVETKLKSSNKGFAMLANMGWVEGQPLGLSGDGMWTSANYQLRRPNGLVYSLLQAGLNPFLSM